MERKCACQIILENSTVSMRQHYPEKTDQFRSGRFYVSSAVALLLLWVVLMTYNLQWPWISQHWPISLTMTLGSFIAGATPQGGAAVAFPVFTKVLHITAENSRTFGFMIQSVGMSMAALYIWSKGITILPRVVFWAVVGGVIGVTLGTFWIVLPNPYPRVLFSLAAAIFGLTLLLLRWQLPAEDYPSAPPGKTAQAFFVTGAGIVGGIFAAQTGSGVDLAVFIVLTLAFGINEKIATPTSVVIMGLVSLYGFSLQALTGKIPAMVWQWWWVAFPVVIFGAPFGAWFASRVQREWLLGLILILILLEFVSTLYLITFPPRIWQVSIAAAIACSVAIVFLLVYRLSVPRGE